MVGTEQEMEVVVLQGAEAGPALYIVSGIHGDERAGWYRVRC
jgi:predicted deacylase